MLHTLVLEHFKQHRYLEIDFESGLNVINGENGAGKSTILKAIMYCLFGAAATAGKKENLSTWGSSAKMECRLSATIGEKLIIISRGLDKSMIYAGDELLASGHTPCTKWVEQELGLDAKMVKQLLYAAQGETQGLLKMGAADLQRKLEQITKIDGIDKILKLISDDLQVLTGKLSMVPEADNLPELEKELANLITLVTTQTNLIEEKKTMVNHTQGQLELQRVRLRNISQSLAEAKEIRAMRSGLETTKKRLESQIAGAEAIRPKISVDALTSGLARAKSNEKQLKIQIDEQNELIRDGKRLHQAFELADTAYQSFLKLVPKYQQRARLQETVTALGNELDILLQDYQALLNHQVDCPTCNRPFDSIAKDAHLAKLERGKKSVEVKREAYDTAFSSLKNFDKETGLVLRGDYVLETERLREAALNAEGALQKYKSMAIVSPESLDTRYAEVQLEVESLTKRLHAVQAWETNHASLLRQVAEIDQDLAGLSLGECDFTDEDLVVLEEDLKQLQDRINQDLEAIAQENAAMQANKSQQATRESQVSEAKEAQHLRRSLEKEQAEAKDLQAFLRNNRARFMKVTWGGVSALTGAYTAEITGGLLSDLTRGDDGEFFITEGEHTVPVSELSGGRQSIVGLALRIALGQTFFGDNSFILLDEVGADLSEANAAAVAGFLSGLGTQVISVSHRQGDSVNAVNVIVL